MNNLYEKAKLYFINTKISKLEKERDNLFSQRKVDMPLQSLLILKYAIEDVLQRLHPLYEIKLNLTNR